MHSIFHRHKQTLDKPLPGADNDLFILPHKNDGILNCMFFNTEFGRCLRKQQRLKFILVNFAKHGFMKI